MIKRFVIQAWLSFKGQQAAFSFEEFVFFRTAYPLLTLVFYCVLAGYSFNTNNLTSWVVGNSFLLCINTCIFSLGNTFTSERYYGRIRSIIVSPVNKINVILHKSFFPCLIAFVTVLIGFCVGSLVFHVSLKDLDLGLFLIVLITAMFAASGFGMFIAVFGLITDQMHFILNLTSYILMIFCGANFPISQLPDKVSVLSKLLPLTRSIEAATMLFHEINIVELYGLLFEEIGIGILYIIISFIIIQLVEKIAVKRATFEVF
jgi:ABC-2 type transport system permease protein